MPKDTIKSKVREVISKVLKVPAEKLSADSSQKTVSSWDSLTHLKLVMELEKKFRISFNTEEVFDMDTVEKVNNTVEKHLL